MTERPVRVLLVDDDPLVCEGLRLMLANASDLAVVGAVHDGADAVAAVHQHFPDVVLLDIRMPRQDGITTTRELVALPSPPHVVVLTTFDHDGEVLKAIQAGAAGFLLKTASPAEILTAVRAVQAGDGALSPRSAAQLRDHVRASFRPNAAQAAAALQRLSARELQVAEAVAEALSNQEIAQRLHVSDATVKAQVASIQDKLGARNRTAIAVLVARADLGP
jgi:DNA-binding NarL/FixJ family response regulator